mgnify:CR=1 FL=1
MISWNPSGKQKPGATITVVIAKKSGKATVPGNLYGKSISAAVTALNNAGFYNIGFCDQNGNPVSGNEDATVTGVSPTGKQSTDSTITLTVALSGSLGLGHEHGRRFRYDQLVATPPLIAAFAANIFAQKRPLAPRQAGALFIDRPGLHSNTKRPAKTSLPGDNRICNAVITSRRTSPWSRPRASRS